MTDKPIGLILDFGGVLTTDLWESVRACARREGLAEDTLVRLLSTDPEIRDLFARLERGEVDQTHFERRLARAAGVSPDGLLARMCADIRPDEAMLAAVARLRDEGVRVGVLSNSVGSGYVNPYRDYGLEQRADAVVRSHEVGLRKPEPAIFGLMLDLLKVDAQDCVFVDDVAPYLVPAEAMGMTVIHHTSTDHTLRRLDEVFAPGGGELT